MVDLQKFPPAVRRAVRGSGVPSRYSKVDEEWLGGYPVEVVDWLRALRGGKIVRADDFFSGKGLLLEGPPGVGKTTLACSIAQEIIREWTQKDAKELRDLLRWPWPYTSVRSVVYMRYEALVETKKEAFEHPPAKELMSALYGRSKDTLIPILVLDDLGHEYMTEYTSFTFQSIIRARYDEGLPTLITTNTPLTQWAGVYGAAAESFGHEAFIRVPMIKKDYRRN